MHEPEFLFFYKDIKGFQIYSYFFNDLYILYSKLWSSPNKNVKGLNTGLFLHGTLDISNKTYFNFTFVLSLNNVQQFQVLLTKEKFSVKLSRQT